ncbi:GGDEF domain-containing protein [Clostridium magnum]|uniref:Response regulator PleD n=1 Tax=Clostridium magnum DSM 2767 TaxID=1121326 RepID=A0A162T2E4_9CLOT|nr:GGDEF domain-containing protein [Clostridium magnum]KZL92163.1 response regulator PleD [Clostridium magnum DSM 2767]SHH19730.1 diguanylate cyclase (GGDEF) domain-containing protein [Clostridium magnum DSM 2767]
MNKTYLNYAPLTLMVLGMGVGIAGYIIDFYIPYSVAKLLWFLATILFAALGLRSGEIVRNLYYNLYNDVLTGLRNRRFFYLNLSYEMKNNVNSKKPITLLMIDIDNFKSINDTYGHIVGDKVLKDMAYIFKDNTRASDTVVRWGGEEFSIILSNTDTIMAAKIAERIRKSIESYRFSYGCTSFKATVSIGTVTINKAMHPENLIDFADKALYKAKEKKNLVIRYEELIYEVET